MKTATLDELLYGEPKLYSEEEIQKMVSGPRSRPIFDYIKNKNENGIMPTVKNISAYVNFGERAIWSAVMHLEKKGLITGIRFKDILARYNVNPKRFPPSHKRLNGRMQKATGCYGDRVNWPDFGDRTKFFLVMSKDENGEAAYYRILL